MCRRRQNKKKMSFSPGEIAGISVGGAVMIIIWLYGIVACIRFYGGSGTAEDKSNILLEQRPATRRFFVK